MNWLVLVSTLPGQNGALRIRAWRTLKALGAATLRDGVYVLPERPELADALAAQQLDIAGSGGSAFVFSLTGQSEGDDSALRALFNRDAGYGDLALSVEAELSKLTGRGEVEARRGLRRLCREAAAIEAIDYFGSPSRDHAKLGLAALEAALQKKFSPDEPTAVDVAIPALEARDYRKRVWATRSRLWVDRVACVWLIGRFIDRKASFVWLDDPATCPADAIGFDFDGAAFSHSNGLSTFEVLLESFGFAGDPALARIAAIVHALDIGGSTVPEAAGFEAMLLGLRDRCRSDDELAAKTSDVFDSLHRAFGEPVPPRGTNP
jgi:hypothetical protein